MNEITVEQIKAWLRSLPGSMSAWSKRDEAMSEAIRRLIEKWFEVQERAAYELANIALGKESNGERILSTLRLLKDIRDFGEEEKHGKR